MIGIDRHPSGRGFAAVILDGRGVASSLGVLDAEEVARAALEMEVELVAVDNIWELGSESEIRRFAGRLLRSELVQVTGSPKGGYQPLSLIGKRLGITGGEKLDPFRSAEVCARAAAMGMGCIVRVYGPETRITISRKRHQGPGGMSAERYRRTVDGAIKSLVEGIKSALNSRGLEYDLSVRKGSHGTAGATFTVYAPRNQLFGLVRQMRTSSVNVKITPLYSKSFEYMPLIPETAKERPKKYLIVGIDPGMVTGVAALDLNGRVVALSSGRGITRGQIARSIAALGRALVFAADVSPPPEMVTKLAAMHSALVFYPDQPLKTSEKSEISNKIAAEQGVTIADSHQRDSLAAAFKAFSFYRNKLEQCASHARLEGDQVDLEEVKALVIRGLSISDAIAKSKAEPPARPMPRKVRASGERERLKVLESKFEDLQAERDSLIVKVKELGSRIEDLEDEIRLTRLEYRKPKAPEAYELERRIRSLLDEVSRLRAEADLLKGEGNRLRSLLKGIADGSHLPLRRLRRLDAGCKALSKPLGGRKVLYLEPVDAIGIDAEHALRELGDVILVFDAPPKAEVQTKLWDLGVPFIVRGASDGTLIDDTLVIDFALLEALAEKANAAMMEGMRNRPDRIKALFEEYRRERRGEALRRGSPSSQELPV